MAFNDGVLKDAGNLKAGEVITSKPYNIEYAKNFEDGLLFGRFCQYVNGTYKNMDGTATPKVAGVVVRKLTGDLKQNAYTSTNDKAEFCNFGYVAVEVVEGDTPNKYDPVYVWNNTANTNNLGKATTQSTNNVALAEVDFWEDLGNNVWIVRIKSII